MQCTAGSNPFIEKTGEERDEVDGRSLSRTHFAIEGRDEQNLMRKGVMQQRGRGMEVKVNLYSQIDLLKV